MKAETVTTGKFHCRICGHEVAPRSQPDPLPASLPWWTELITGGAISSARLQPDGCYGGLSGSTLYGVRVRAEEIDWDKWRAKNICPACKGVAVAEPMLGGKICEHCGAWFDSNGAVQVPEPGAGNRASGKPPTKEYCERLLAQLRPNHPDVVVEFGRCGFQGNPPLWYARDEDHGAELVKVIKEGRIVGIDDESEPPWVRRVRARAEVDERYR